MGPPRRRPAGLRPLAWAGALAALLAAGGSPAAEEGSRGLPQVLEALRPDLLAREGRASFRHSDSDEGSPEDVFDGRPGTALRTRDLNPAFLEVVFDSPKAVKSATACFTGGDPHEWSLLAGDDPDRLEVVFERHHVPAEAWSPVEILSPAVRARVFRVVVKRLSGGDSVGFGEIALRSRQTPERLELLAPSVVVAADGPLTLRARVRYDGGHRAAGVRGLEFETPPGAPLALAPSDPSGPAGALARFAKPGVAPVRLALQGARDVRLESPWTEIECRASGRPDWSVGWIERTPRLPFDGPNGGLPQVGSAVVYRAHVKNYGTSDAPRVECRWEVDGKVAATGALDALARFAEGTADLPLPWDGLRHDVRFVVDPGNAVAETSEGNNAVTIQSDALRLGFWVERPLLDRFHANQAAFGDGANGWEDWAQRQVARWNRMLAGARYPLTPDGVPERVALDLVVEAAEDALPLHEGRALADPDSADRTVDLQRGFPARLLEGALYRGDTAPRDDNALWFEGALLEELSRARYLVDLRRLEVRAAEVVLPLPLDLPVDGDGFVHRTRSGVMMGGAHAGGYGPHAAFALRRIAGLRARGSNRGSPPVAGEFLSDLPRRCRIRVLAADGRPLAGATVRAWRRAPGPGGTETFRGEPVREGTSAEGGLLDLTLQERDPFFEGRKSGAFDPGRAVLLLEVTRGGRSCRRFLEVVPYNLAFWSGSAEEHLEDVPTDLPR